MKRSPASLVVAVVLALGTVLPSVAQTYNGQQLQGRVTYVPSGTTLDAVLTSAIDSSVSRPGDLFSAKLNAPLYLGSELVLPANTVLEGQLSDAAKAGITGKNGMLTMRLTAAVTPEGTRYPLSAVVTAAQTDKKIHEDKDGNLKGRTTKASVGSGVARTAAWTAGGTLLGICFAPIVGGAVGAGAIAGVATGGAVGLGSNVWRKGKDVKISSNTKLQFALDQPMSLAPGLAGTGQLR
ncbi:MAG: TrbI/VirB10 family protein [Candidatus Obscuribacterales bacterium]|nr:TrbI/VirB10 family protein [Candidatus Obscuribacterales bacterium]